MHSAQNRASVITATLTVVRKAAAAPRARQVRPAASARVAPRAAPAKATRVTITNWRVLDPLAISSTDLIHIPRPEERDTPAFLVAIPANLLRLGTRKKGRRQDNHHRINSANIRSVLILLSLLRYRQGWTHKNTHRHKHLHTILYDVYVILSD